MSDYWLDQDGRVYGRTFVPKEQSSLPAPLPAAEVAERVTEVLAQTEIVRLAPGHDVVFTPDVGWDLRGAPGDMLASSGMRGGQIEWKMECSEETFWNLCAFFLGMAEVLEMKDYVSALADWEGEGGSCMVE